MTHALKSARCRLALIALFAVSWLPAHSRADMPDASDVLDYGFKALISPRFADIFRTNCTKNGLLPIELPAQQCATLASNVLFVSMSESSTRMQCASNGRARSTPTCARY